MTFGICLIKVLSKRLLIIFSLKVTKWNRIYGLINNRGIQASGFSLTFPDLILYSSPAGEYQPWGALLYGLALKGRATTTWKINLHSPPLQNKPGTLKRKQIYIFAWDVILYLGKRPQCPPVMKLRRGLRVELRGLVWGIMRLCQWLAWHGNSTSK